MAKKKTFSSPDSQEREQIRALLRFSKQLQRDVTLVLLPKIDEIIEQFKTESRADGWTDTLDTVMAELAKLAFHAIFVTVTKLPKQFDAVSKFNEGQFKLVVKANTKLPLPPVMPGAPKSSILGVNVFRSEPFLQPLAEGWISENTSLIKSLPTRLHPDLEGIIRRGVMNGASVKTIKEQIKKQYGTTDSRAKLIAQDQILKLNADLTRYRLQSVGVKRYVWRTVKDNRVRPEHVEREGRIYSWENGAGGEHPGEPVRCRCHAEAIWDDDSEPD
jgi:SPP1 gp7 family putative phage head morphogenesis protein